MALLHRSGTVQAGPPPTNQLTNPTVASGSDYALAFFEINMPWIQRTLELPPASRGFHLITRYVQQAMPELADIEIGLLHLFLQHTSAALTINENADPDVQVDLEASVNAIAPENFPYIHTCEGPDDMPAHVKSSLLGCSLTVPVSGGRLALGTWQGIYLAEHRNHAHSRRVVLTLQGE